MMLDKCLNKYLEGSTDDIRIKFYQKCFYIVINSKYNYNDGDNQFVDGFYLDNGSVIYYANMYFYKYASDDLKKQYLNNSVLSKQLEIKDEYSKLVTEQEKLEYVYNWCLRMNWFAKKLIPVGMALNISTNNIRKKGIKYAIEYLGISKEELRKTLNNSNLVNMREVYSNSKYNDIFKKIYYEHDMNKVVNILDRNQVVVSEMLCRVNPYVKLYGDILDKNSSSKEIANSLKEKVNYYANYKKDMAKQDSEREKKLKEQDYINSLLESANVYIEKLVTYVYNNQGKDSVENIENNFCFNNDLDKKLLDKYKEVVEKYNKKLYVEYFYTIQIANNLRERQILFACLNLKDILMCDSLYKETMLNVRPNFNFNSIDYYQLFDIPLDELYKKVDDISIKLDIKVIKLIKYFAGPYYLKRNYPLNDRDVRLILKEIKETRCERDENGFPIRGTGIILTREEKIQILDYLRDNNIPGINKNVYKDACEKYMDGKLFKLNYKTRKLENV